MTDTPLYAGIELGGTKCIATLAHDPESILGQERIATTSPEETLTALNDLLRFWQQHHDFAALGIASFGPLCLDQGDSLYGHILATNKPHWSLANVLGPLTELIDKPVFLDTDVNGAAYAECTWGTGAGLDNFAYVTVGTGIGVGLIVNGATPKGFSHGELGHMLVGQMPDDDFHGICKFHRNCVEGLACGEAIRARLMGADPAQADEDHPVWETVIDALARLCHNIACTTAPRLISMGGGVIAGQPHLLPRIEERFFELMDGYIKIPAAKGYIAGAQLGKQVGPLGPIALARAHHT